MERKKNIVFFGAIVLSIAMITASAGVLAATENRGNAIITDASPMQPLMQPLMDPGDILFDFDVQTPTGDNQCLGVEFDGEYFWVTGGGAAADPNKLYKFDASGSLIDTFDQPGHSTSWGWRDLAFDGTYLYASVDTDVDQIDPVTGMYTGETIPGPENPNRALAYDPATDHFFTANWGSPIYEFNRDGDIINTFANSLSLYGLAFDDFSPGGPYLWTYSQDGVDPILVQISQFDIAAGDYTGVTFEGLYGTEGMAGGACFYVEDETAVFVGLTQGAPVDLVFGMDVTASTEPELEIEMSGGFGVSAVITTVGAGDATDVDWSITLDGGLIILGKETTGTVASIPAGESATVKSSFILGLGNVNITTAAVCVEGASAEKAATAKVFLFFVLGMS